MFLTNGALKKLVELTHIGTFSLSKHIVILVNMSLSII